MGRIFGSPTATPTTIPTTGGRIFGRDNPNVQPLNNASWGWENMPLGEKIWRTAKELPTVLYSFIPQSVKEAANNPKATYPELIKGALKGVVEFGAGIAGVTTQAIGGAVLGGVEKITGKPQRYEIPGVKTISEKLGLKGIPSEISSYQQQSQDLQKQGFTSAESKALVGMNAYLGIMPVAGRLARTGALTKLGEKIATKEVPFAETPEGIRVGIKAGIKPKLAQEARKYKSAEEFVKAVRPTRYLDTTIGETQFYDHLTKKYRGEIIGSPIDLGDKVKIYRATSGYQDFLPGDFVSIHPGSAEFYKTTRGEAKILSKEVLVKDLLETKNREYIYAPDGQSQLTDFYNQVPKEVPPVRVERPFITGIKRIFGKTEEQKQFHDVLQEHMDKYFEGRSELLSKEEPLNKSLVELSDKELANYSKFTQGFQIPETEITQKLKTAVDLWKKVSKEEQTYLIEKGKLTEAQIEARRWKPVEMITGRTREELKAMGVDPQYYPYLAEDLLKKSDFIATTGKRTKGGYLKRFTGKMLQEDTYIKDPKIAIPRHRLQVFRDKMNSELVDTIKETFAEQDKMIIKKYRTDPRFAEQMGVEEWKPAGTLRFYPIVAEGMKKAVGVTKKVESYWVPKEVANELNKFYKPGTLEKILRMTYDPLIDMWRVSVLGMVPRWLYNNFVGNTMLAILGKTDPFAFAKSAKEILARTKLGEKAGIAQREIPKGVFVKEYAGGEMAKAGQLGSLAKERTQFLRPIENWLNLLEQAKNYKALRIPAIATQNLIRGWIALGKPIGYLNKVTENWFRGAIYISKSEGKFLGFQLDKPVPPVEGLKYVNEFLFDYTNLSRAERATFRRALPFYNWMKNITGFSLKFPINHPLRGLIAGALLQDYVDYINEVNQKEDKTKSVLRIKTDMTYEGKPLYINVKSAIPFSDVFRTIPTDFETFGRFLTSNPVSKIIIERGFKINSFTGQPFSQPTALQQFDEYGKPILPLPSLVKHLGMQVPQTKMIQSIADQLRYGKVLKRYETGEPKIYHGQIQTSDLLMEVLGYFGVKLSATEYNAIKQSVDKKERRQEIKGRQYEQQIKSGLERLRVQ